MPPLRQPAPAPEAARALAADLTRTVAGRVAFDAGSRALYATDASNYRIPPIGVVWPRDRDDVLAAIEVCRQHEAPLLPRGAGTSLAGQCCNTAVVLDLSRHLDRVLEIDPEARLARVEPGVVLDDLQRAAAPHGLAFGPDPATHGQCTVGGMLGNDACGVHSLLAGRTEDNVRALTVATYGGLRLELGRTPPDELARRLRTGGDEDEIYRRLAALADRIAPLVRERFPDIPRRVSGYSLPQLLPENGFDLARSLVGSEGTCATILEATLELVPLPRARALLLVGFADVTAAADVAPLVLAARPIGLEGLEHRLFRLPGRGAPADLPPAGGWLLVELGDDEPRAAAARAAALARRLEREAAALFVAVHADPAAQRRVWEVREAGLATASRTPSGGFAWEGWEDSAVPPHRLGPYLRELRRLLVSFGYGEAAFYGHFGQGCVHTRIPFDLASAEGIGRFRSFVEAAADLVVAHGGSLSGEHGDGQARGELLERMYGGELVAAFGEMKSIWDPRGRMNPGKVVDPRPLDGDLRLGAGWSPARPPTRFALAADEGSLGLAALRCVGVGKCRRRTGGTMCPSFRATRDEAHSTRGRARLLFEMLHGDLLPTGFLSREVKEALDLCLACKGCKSDCPAGVDMATYKAEFLAHHYRGRLRPRGAYTLARVHTWARLAGAAPRLANALVSVPAVARLVRTAGGITRERPLPLLAKETFRRWFSRRPSPPARSRRVLLWPDTFTDRFHPEVGRAAVAALEAAGFTVALPERDLCCGRPLYDWGLLGPARRRLSAILAALEGEIEAGTPLVGLEPSCTAVFRDELPDLLGGDPRASRLAAGTFTLGELLAREAPGFPWPRLPGRAALYHGHCHQKAVMGTDADRALLAERLGLALATPDTGCCGMAGAFGFEAGKYEVSVACGEAALLPAVRAAVPSALLVADGFSCRTQIAQLTGRKALHTAEVLALALAEGAAG